MRIGVDARQIENCRKLTGIGRYIVELCKQLHEVMPDAQFFLYGQSELRLPLDSVRFIPRVEQQKWARRLKSVIWLKTRAGRMVREDRLDAYWAVSTLLPNLGKGLKSLVTVHDLNHLVVPESMPATTLWTHRLFFRRDIRRAAAVATNSAGTARRLEKQLGIETRAVVYPAASRLFSPPGAAVIADVLRRHGLPANYLLTVATLEPRKNLECLITAFLALRESGELLDYQLVLVGGDGWKNDRLRAQIAANTCSIRSLGYVPDADLPALYAGCRAFVFPSVYEGFGIPALEARLCGAKVVAADVPEIREACGDVGHFVQPDVAGLMDGIRWSVAVDGREAAEMAASAPSWRQGAETMAAIFRSLS